MSDIIYDGIIFIAFLAPAMLIIAIYFEVVKIRNTLDEILASPGATKLRKK